jgi:hypothetical protein
MKTRAIFKVGSAVLVSAFLAVSMQAQATRTWVSGVGDDVNPCSRTAPCKTFAGAISKTAAGGEIDTLDPGGFGAVTITKSIIIDGIGGGESSVLSSGVQGVIINALTTDTITLRNIQINGAGTTLGTNGVHVIQAGKVNLDNVFIANYSARAVLIDTTQAVKVTIRNCSIQNIQQTAIVAGLSAATPAVQVEIDNTRIAQNGVAVGSGGAVFANNGGRVTIRNSVLTQNTAAAVEAGTNGEVFVDNCELSYSQVGARSSGGTVRLSRSALLYNTGNAADNLGGSILTYGDNRMAGNGTNNTGTAAAPGLQ